ncbi:MAG: L-threonylcarbamoyladenylate synthase [Planctomycetota bacterium]
MATVVEPTNENIRSLAEVLRDGGLVAVPTETVYGLAANGLDADACRRIFEAKDRPAYDPLILHLLEPGWIDRIAVGGEAVARLAERFWPGPLTVVLTKKPIVPDIVTAGLDSVAVRVPSHPAMRSLLAACDVPLAAPSANPFGYVSPTRAEHVVDGLGDRIDYVLDGGSCQIGVESTIVDLRDPERPVLLRPGGVTPSQIRGVLGDRLAVGETASEVTEAAQAAPGQLSRHYSPKVRVELHHRLEPAALPDRDTDEALVFLSRPGSPDLPSHWHWLSESGDLEEAAARLFALLRELDAGSFRTVHVELAPEEGLGLALNDRLRRAAQRSQSS